MVSVCHAVAVGVIDEAATAAASARAALGGAAMGGPPSACPELHGGRRCGDARLGSIFHKNRKIETKS